MGPNPPTPHRRAVLWKEWIGFFALFVLLGGILWGVDAAGRRQEAIEAHENATARLLGNIIRNNYASRDQIPQMEADLNGGRPLPRQRVDLPIGSFDRITLEGRALAPGCQGWKVQVDYSATPRAIWTHIRTLPPPATSKFVARMGSEEMRHTVEKLRLLLLIICASTWLIVIAPALVAGPMRRELGQVAMAAALLALLAWSADPERRAFASLPSLNWVFIASSGGLFIGLLSALLPVRAPHRRPDRCPTCHYDLTGNVSGTCPECGNPTPAELRRRHHEELEPLAQAIASTGRLVEENDQSEKTEESEFPISEPQG